MTGMENPPPPGPAALLRAFHAALGQGYGSGSVHDCVLRRKLHRQEHRELIEAIDARDRMGIARELADVVYVAYGTADTLGIDLDAVFAEIHAANLRKFNPPGPLFDPDGKLLKPPGWTPPDVARVLREAA